MYRKFTPILEAIQSKIGNQLKREVDIHLTIFENYESGIDALAQGKIDFVRFGPSSYIIAEQQNKNIKILAMELRRGLKTFNGVIIAHKDSGITSMNDLKGKAFAFGDKYSTIGRFLSQALLLEHGIDATSLSSFDYLQRHDLVAKAIITGSHDAGALKASTYKKLCNPDEIIVVKSFENTTKPWVARESLPKKIRDAITASLLELENDKIIGELGCSGFTNSTPSDYNLVREGMKNSKAFDPKTKEAEKESD